jgi:hypothetical protein
MLMALQHSPNLLLERRVLHTGRLHLKRKLRRNINKTKGKLNPAPSPMSAESLKFSA